MIDRQQAALDQSSEANTSDDADALFREATVELQQALRERAEATLARAEDARRRAKHALGRLEASERREQDRG